MKGVLTAIGEEDAEAQLGNLRVRVSFDDILRAGEEDDQSIENESGQPKISARVRKALSIMNENPSKPSILHASPGMEIDIRGEMSEDAIDKMDRFIESAYLSGMPFVRIIHGKGTGKLRQVVRDALSKSSFVDRWESGTDREGGDGVTVAFMGKD
jgi:DNA mismatch repair protein MutS2